MTVRSIVRRVHLWLAIVLCVPLVLIGLSGSALLVQREILRQTAPSAARGPMQPIERLIAAARPAAPAETRAAFVELPPAPGEAALVQFETGRRPSRRTDVRVDPVTLQVLGAEPYVRRGPLKSVIVDIHEFLMLPAHIGFPTVGWMGVGLTFLALSGIVLWWPRKGQWLRAFLVRRGARGLRLHVDLHHAVGIWGLAFLLCLGVSGVYLVFPVTTGAVLKTLLSDEATVEDPDVPPSAIAGPLDADGAVKVAQAAIPHGRVLGVQLANGTAIPYVVQLEPAGFGPKSPPVMVTIDRQSGDVTYIDDPRGHSPVERTMNLLHALHFSQGIGWLWTFLVFLSGLLPLVLAVTGLTIWWKARRARQAAAPAAAE